MSNPVTVPTAISIKTRFPEFADVDDTVIEFAIEEARLEVGDNWVSGQNVALAYLVAHYVAASITAAAGGGTGDGGELASESIGRFSFSYAAVESASREVIGSSSYGRRYEQLRDRNFGGPVVI